MKEEIIIAGFGGQGVLSMGFGAHVGFGSLWNDRL